MADLIKSNWKSTEHGERRLAPRDAQQSPGMPGERRSSPGASPPAGLGARDTDRASVSSLLVDTGIFGLQILPAGTQLQNPSELFGSPGMQPVLDQLPLLADVVLLDTPPVLAVPDTAILGSSAHGAVVVASEGRTESDDLERTDSPPRDHPLPSPRRRRQPGAALHHRLVSVLRLQAMTRGATVRARRPIAHTKSRWGRSERWLWRRVATGATEGAGVR